MLDKIIELHGKKVMLLENAITKNTIPDSVLADFWVVNNLDSEKVKIFLMNVLQSNDPNIYLKPIFLQKEFKKGYFKEANLLKNLTDGFVKDLNFIDKIPYIEAIINFIEQYQSRFKDQSDQDFEISKILNYYYSRKKNILPLLSRKSLTGYSYPRIDAMLNNTQSEIKNSQFILREAYTNGLLSRSYVDTSHLCKKCKSGFLNLREVCPICLEHDLKVRNLIHHFRCAYVGSEKDFAYKDKLVCPKCLSELKNLGVDYDKPGKVFYCKNKKCSHEFQDAPIGVHCVDCKTEQTPDELIVKKTYSYELTNLGFQFVLEND